METDSHGRSTVAALDVHVAARFKTGSAARLSIYKSDGDQAGSSSSTEHFYP